MGKHDPCPDATTSDICETLSMYKLHLQVSTWLAEASQEYLHNLTQASRQKLAKPSKFIEQFFLQVERSVKTEAEHLKGENGYENSFFWVWLFEL